MVLYIENPEDRKLLLVLINETGKVAGYKINTQKFLAFLCTNSKSLERKTKETIPFTIILKRIINDILDQMDLNSILSKTREIYIFYKCTSNSLQDRLQVSVNLRKLKSYQAYLLTTTLWQKKLSTSEKKNCKRHKCVEAKYATR